MIFPRIIADQPPIHPVDVAGWATDEEFGIHPVGSKPKRMLIAPTDVAWPFIIPGHSYILKSAAGWREQQIWSEIIAYRVGKLLNLPIPPSFIAHNSATNEVGVLVEFFFGYPGEESPARLIHGVDVISSIYQGSQVGQPHTVMSNERVTRIILGQVFGMDWWTAAYTFDALIANTDRHTENWGLLVRRSTNGQTSYEIAPLYDNGTSLGFQISETNLTARMSCDALEQFNTAGLHQVGWDVRNSNRVPHFELCKKLLEVYPNSVNIMRHIMGFDMTDVDRILDQCVTYDVPVLFTARRAAFVSALIRSRRDKLSAMLG